MSHEKKSVLHDVVLSSDMKEVMAAHTVVMIIAALVYLFQPVRTAILVLVGGTVLELVVFHTLWFYRENVADDSVERPVLQAIITEIINIGVGVLGVAVLWGLGIVAGRVTDIHPFQVVIGGSILAFFVFIGWGAKLANKARNQHSE